MRKNLNTMKTVGMNVLRGFIFSSIVRKQWIMSCNKMNTCKTCRWYAAFDDVCCNGDSEHRADFRLEDETCEKWEESNE